MCKQMIDEIKEEKIDISSILEKAGRFQAWMYLLSCLPAIFVSMLSVNFVFVAGHVDHRCRVLECEGTDSTFLPTWWPSSQIDSCSRPILNESLVGLDPVCTNTSFTDRVEICTDWVYENNDTIVADLNLGCQPWKVNFIGTAHGIGMIIAMLGSGYMCDRCRVPECDSKEPVLSPTWWPNPDIDRCYRPLINHTSPGSICTNDSFVNATAKCSDWVYENNDTIVAELNLACEPWKVSFVGTAHGIGMIISMLASGWMCDRFGRKPTLIVCTLGCLIGNFKVLATSYNVYIVLEFLEGAITTGAYTAATVIMSENSSKKTRIVAGVLIAYAIYMGEAVLACIAMFVSNWKNILYIICSPPILFTCNIFFLNESPRWQILNGRIKEAKESLKRMVKMNNLGIEPQVIDRISEENLKNVFGLNNNVTTEGFREVIRSKEILKRLIAGVVWRLAVSFIYYSMLVNSVFLPGDKYTTFLMTALASFPGELIYIYLMNKIGRRKPLQCGFLLCGINCIAIAFVPPSYRWVKITLFLIGKLIVSAIYTGSVVYTVELFPTSVRGSCIGICTLASCGGTMLAPLTPALDLVSPVLGAFIYAFLAITASALFFITPETRDSTLYDTIEQITISSNARKHKKKHENIQS